MSDYPPDITLKIQEAEAILAQIRERQWGWSALVDLFDRLERIIDEIRAYLAPSEERVMEDLRQVLSPERERDAS